MSKPEEKLSIFEELKSIRYGALLKVMWLAKKVVVGVFPFKTPTFGIPTPTCRQINISSNHEESLAGRPLRALKQADAGKLR